MSEREIDRRRQRDRTPASPAPAPHGAHPILALQRAVGNRAVAQVLARSPATTGSVAIPGVGAIKVRGGNLEQWAGKDTPDTVEVESEKGKHSGKLEKMATERTKADVKVKISAGNKAGEELNVGGGVELEIPNARVKDYVDASGSETWRVADFTNVHRTKTTHKVS
jgi:hypothetical protein